MTSVNASSNPRRSEPQRFTVPGHARFFRRREGARGSPYRNDRVRRAPKKRNSVFRQVAGRTVNKKI